MRLTLASQYAVIALVYLARQGGQVVASHDIARAEAMPSELLLKVLQPLVRAGVLYSLKGPSGGYCLARPADTVTLLNVIEVVEGPLAGDVGDRDGSALARRLQAVCDQAAAKVRRRLARVTVAYLAKRG